MSLIILRLVTFWATLSVRKVVRFLFVVMRSYLNLAFHCDIGGYNIVQKGSSRSFGGQHSRSSWLTFFLCWANASTDCIILLLGVRFIIFTSCNGCAFTYRSSMNPSCTMKILTWIPCFSNNGNRTIEWLCLVMHAISRSWVVDNSLVVLCGLY
jgi:hypothetical protein